MASILSLGRDSSGRGCGAKKIEIASGGRTKHPRRGARDGGGVCRTKEGTSIPRTVVVPP